MKPIAVQGCKLTVTPPGDAKITTPPETDVIIDNKNAYFGTLSITVSNATTTGADSGTGTGTLSGSSVNTTNHNKKAVLQDDECKIKVTGKQTSHPFSTTSWTVTVKISVAGQTSTLSD